MDSVLHAFNSRTLTPTLYPSVFSLNNRGDKYGGVSWEVRGTHLRSRSLIPLTLFWVYWTTSEKRKAKEEAETSAVRVLLRCLSYIFGLRLGLGVPRVVLIEGVFGRENLLEFGDRCSADEREEDERTENRGF